MLVTDYMDMVIGVIIGASVTKFLDFHYAEAIVAIHKNA